MSPHRLHAACVAAEGPDGPCAALILGPSGAGKSALALEMIARGGVLVADDQVALRVEGGRLLAAAPPALQGLVEARGIGLLRLPFAPEAPVALVADLRRAEPHRLPPRRRVRLCGVALPRLLAAGFAARPGAAAALIALLRAGGARHAPRDMPDEAPDFGPRDVFR